MSKRVWQCDTCGEISHEKPWSCPVCGEETCDSCFDRFSVCAKCSLGKSDDELKILAKWEGDDC
jgi:rRNA maturation protein Nop10